MVNDVEVDALVKFHGPYCGLALPAVVIPMEARGAQLRIQVIVDIEVDPLEMDAVSPRILLNRTPHSRNRGGVGEHPDLMTARGSQQGAESNL